jgi:tRNA(Ile)-lysidine synthase TilS/MesJ
VGEEEARAYAKECELPIIGCCCPACGDLGLQRQRTKRMLMELEREHPGVKQSMLKALSNVAPRHLLDVRLNPPAELRAKVRPLESLGAALSHVEGRLKRDNPEESASDPSAVGEPATMTGAGRVLTMFR